MNSNDYLRNANNLYTQNFYSDAIRECSKALELEPNNAEACELKGIAYYYIEDITNALVNLNKAISLNPLSSRAFCYRGICYSNEMIASANKEIVFDKPSSFTLKGYNLDSQTIEKFTQALNDENKAIELDYENIVAYQARGEVYFWLEDYERAMVDLNKVINEYPNDCIEAYITRAKINFIFKNYDCVIDDLRKVKKILIRQ